MHLPLPRAVLPHGCGWMLSLFNMLLAEVVAIRILIGPMAFRHTFLFS